MINNSDLRYGAELIEGVNSDGLFCKSKANTIGIDLKPYKIVNNGDFVYNPSRLNLGSLAYRFTGMCIVSHLYVVFHLNEEGKKCFLPGFLYMYFNRKEFLRLVTFLNLGSQRPEFNFYDMSEIKVPMPSIEVQQELVDTYSGLKSLAEQNEALIAPLSKACEAFVADCKSKYPEVQLGEYINQRREKNNNYAVPILGVTSEGFIPPKQEGVNTSIYNVFYKYDFVFNPARMELNSIYMNLDHEKAICSSLYEIFYVCKRDKLLPEFLNLFLKRKEFARYCWYDAIGSARNYFRVANMQNMKFPLPPIEVQRSIVNLYNCLEEAKKIASQAREQLKTLCPALVQRAANS